MQIALTDEIRYDLERRLARRKFMGVEIGLTLKSLLLTTKETSFCHAVKQMMHLLRFLVFGPRRRKAMPQLRRGIGLILLNSDSPRLVKLILPIVSTFNQDEYNVMTCTESAPTCFPKEVGWCRACCALPLHSFSARVKAVAESPCYLGELYRWVRDNRLPVTLIPEFLFNICYRYVYIKGAYEFLEKVRPRFVMADYEHLHPWSSLFLVARRKGIQTLNLMHGEIYSAYAWMPLLSDVIACWGESQKRQLIGLGLDAGRIRVCGCPRIDRSINVDVAGVRSRLCVDATKPVALLATNPILWEYREKQVVVFAEALKDIGTVQGLVRLHPSERLEQYAGLSARFPWVKFYDAQSWTLEESIAVSRVVVNHDSGLGDDALVYGRPVIELDVLPIGLTNGRKLVERAGCPLAKDAGELRKTIVDLCTNEDSYRRHLGLAEPFVKDLFFAVGDEAGRNTASVLREIAVFDRTGN